MTTGVSISPQSSARTTASLRAVVFVEGVFDAGLRVLEVGAAAPRDERWAVLSADHSLRAMDDADRAALKAYVGKAVEICWLMRFGEEEERIDVFLSGRIVSLDTDAGEGGPVSLLRAVGAETLPIDGRVIEETWWQRVAAGSVVGSSRGWTPDFGVDPTAFNRAPLEVQVNGLPTPLFTDTATTAKPWRVESMLRALAADAGRDWDITLLDSWAGQAPALRDAGRAGSLRECVRRLADDFSLVLRTDRESGASAPVVSWRSVERGGAIALNGVEDQDARLRAEALRAKRDEQGAVLLMARAARVLEGTFVLKHAWDPAQQGKATTEYDRATSTDFGAVADVYRRFALNEDAAYSGPPHSQSAFDSRAFFEDPLEPAVRLRFEPMLTHAWTDHEAKVRVEYSVNSGGAWADYPGRIEMDANRAALRLVEAALPSGFAAAGNAGTLRVRITACLASARGLQRTRMLGNPFAMKQEREIVALDASVGVAALSASSRFLSQVRSGAIAADEHDDTALIDLYLAQQVRRARFSASAQLTLGPVDPSIRTGDRVERLAGEGWQIDLSAADNTLPSVWAVRHILEDADPHKPPRTVITLRS